MLWPSPLACVSSALLPPGARLGCAPWRVALASRWPPRYNSLLTLYTIDDGRGSAACRSVARAAMRRGMSRAHFAPARCAPGALQGGFTSAAPFRS
jgi:hypothetical protein